MKSNRQYYLEQAEVLGLSPMWKEYLAILADELTGGDVKTGNAIISQEKIAKKETLEIIQKMVEDRQITGDCELAKLVNAKEISTIQNRIWRSQIRKCLPLIEIERCSYISAHYGRIESVLGVDYWNPDVEEYRVLWKYDASAMIDNEHHDEIKCIGAPIQNPYEIDIDTLNKMGYFEKKLEMLGTTSYTPFFSMLGENRERIGLLADSWKRLTRHKLCDSILLERLFEGHYRFIDER